MRRIFIDPERCTGCKNCQVACMAERSPSHSVWLVDLSDPANQPRNFVELDRTGRPVPLACRHCDEPQCVAACIAGALAKDPVSGVVSHNREHCASCWMCVMSCPFGMIVPEWAEGKVPVKCDLCGGADNPRCVEACPTGAISLIELNSMEKHEGFVPTREEGSRCDT